MAFDEDHACYESQRLWPDERWGPWCLDLRWTITDQRWTLTGLTIRSGFRTDGGRDALAEAHDRYRAERPSTVEAPGGSRELTARELRSLRLGEIVQEEAARRQRFAHGGDGTSPVAAAYAVHSGPAGPGRPPLYGPEHFARVADVYSTAYRNRSRNPTLTVSKEFQVSRSTAAKWVARARTLGFLKKTRKRVAGGVHQEPAHTVGLCDLPAPPHVRFSGVGGSVYTVWVANPHGIELDRCTSLLGADSEVQQGNPGSGLARLLVEHLGHVLSPAEDRLLRRFTEHRTDSAFWRDAADAGLLMDGREHSDTVPSSIDP